MCWLRAWHACAPKAVASTPAALTSRCCRLCRTPRSHLPTVMAKEQEPAQARRLLRLKRSCECLSAVRKTDHSNALQQILLTCRCCRGSLPPPPQPTLPTTPPALPVSSTPALARQQLPSSRMRTQRSPGALSLARALRVSPPAPALATSPQAAPALPDQVCVCVCVGGG